MNKLQFTAALDKLKKSNPGHDMIAVIEERGFDYLSVEYLKLALKDPVEKSAPEYTAEFLFNQKSSLYSKRAQHSNKFHSCTNNNERAEVSIAIGSIQSQIIANRKLLDEYTTTGKLPKLPEKLVKPLDGRRQQMNLHSYRSSRSRFKKKLLIEKDPDKIKYYESELERLDKAIAELSA